MATFFTDETSNSFRDEVPWHNTYNKDSKNLENESIVEKIVICDTGLLLIASDFKDFVYKNKKTYDLMLNALEFYVSKPSESLPFILRCSNKRSSDMGILDEYEGAGVWKKDPKGFIFDSGKAETKNTSTASNPFLPTNTTRAKKAKRGTEDK
jgi:hypothetical protein